MNKVKFFTIDVPKTETNLDGTLTSYVINSFLNEGGIEPFDVSLEYNEFTDHLLVSIAYKEEKSLLKTAEELLTGHAKGYQTRFVTLGEYRERAHTVYIQLPLENELNRNSHMISHGIYVEKGTAKAMILEYKHDEE